MTKEWGAFREFAPVSLEFGNDAGDFECYVWRRPDGVVTINSQMYRLDEGSRVEATLSPQDARRVAAALSSAASFAEGLS